MKQHSETQHLFYVELEILQPGEKKASGPSYFIQELTTVSLAGVAGAKITVAVRSLVIPRFSLNWASVTLRVIHKEALVRISVSWK